MKDLINTVHNCDNLQLMIKIPNKSIDLIYCDILYGTGNKTKDYQDLKPIKHTIYQHYVDRLSQMHRILKDNGTIYLQMDYRIVHWVRCILDDIFGYQNFRNQIIVQFNIGGRGKRQFAKKHDNIIVYSKSNDYIFNDMQIRIPYKSVVSKKQQRPNITAEKLEMGTIPTNIWSDIPSGLKVKKHSDYYSQKHPKILQRIILASSNQGDLIADFYMGSGTTLVVAKGLNRNYIGCDINKRAFDITNERLIKVCENEISNNISM